MVTQHMNDMRLVILSPYLPESGSSEVCDDEVVSLLRDNRVFSCLRGPCMHHHNVVTATEDYNHHYNNSLLLHYQGFVMKKMKLAVCDELVTSNDIVTIHPVWNSQLYHASDL